MPLATLYMPQLILISAGYDAHRDDPLAECMVSDEGFAAMARSIRLVGELLGVPVGCVLEGGYDLGALARSVAATLESFAATDGAAAAERQPSAIALEARRRLAPAWPGLPV